MLSPGARKLRTSFRNELWTNTDRCICLLVLSRVQNSSLWVVYICVVYARCADTRWYNYNGDRSHTAAKILKHGSAISCEHQRTVICLPMGSATRNRWIHLSTQPSKRTGFCICVPQSLLNHEMRTLDIVVKRANRRVCSAQTPRLSSASRAKSGTQRLKTQHGRLLAALRRPAGHRMVVQISRTSCLATYGDP